MAAHDHIDFLDDSFQVFSLTLEQMASFLAQLFQTLLALRSLFAKLLDLLSDLLEIKRHVEISFIQHRITEQLFDKLYSLRALVAREKVGKTLRPTGLCFTVQDSGYFCLIRKGLHGLKWDGSRSGSLDSYDEHYHDDFGILHQTSSPI
jgi:hypothetical protein